MSSKRSGGRGGARSSTKKRKSKSTSDADKTAIADMREYDFAEGGPSWRAWEKEKERDNEEMLQKFARFFPLTKDGRPTKILSPRFASCLYDAAVVFGEDLRNQWDRCSDAVYPPSRKSLACYYGKADKVWRENLSGCFSRLAMRISKGSLPVPNCVGEIVALRTMVRDAKHYVGEYHDVPEDDLDPERYADVPMARVRGIVPAAVNRCFDEGDWLVIKILFGEKSEDELEERYVFDPLSDDDASFSSTSSNEDGNKSEEEIDDSPTARAADFHKHLANQFERNAKKYPFVFDDGSQEDKLAYAQRKIRKEGLEESAQCVAKAMNLHPRRWFVPFRTEEMTNHL